jgi:hypothetical protein
MALAILIPESAALADPVSDEPAITAKQGPVSISPLVLIQAQLAPYVGKDALLQTGDPAERGGFRLRRARLGFEGTIADRVPFAISGELVSDVTLAARLTDAYFGYRVADCFAIYVGAHKVPFSRSALTEPSKGSLIERPFAVQAMAPFRQVGAHVEGKLFSKKFGYALGLYNGLERSDQFYVGYIENSAAFGNRFDDLAYSARLTAEPMGSLGGWIPDVSDSSPRIGAGASYFFSHGGTRSIHGGGVDALLHAHGVHLLAEFLWNRTSPNATPTQETAQFATVQAVGAVAEAGYFINDLRIGAAARFEWIDPNTAVKDAGDGWVVAGGLNYLFAFDRLRAQLDYTHRQERYVPQIKNDTLLLQLQLAL